MKKTLNIAHRGFSGNYPENTMLAFRQAVLAGCQGIETDLHMTADGVLVICHDETLDRTTNATGYIRDYTWKELAQVDAGSTFGPQFCGEKIPTLDEFLDYVRNKELLINLELKNDIIAYQRMEEKVVQKIHEFQVSRNIILSSFHHSSMVKVKQLDPTIRTGLLYSCILYEPEKYALRVGADALHPQYRSVLDAQTVQHMKQQGIAIHTYTVDDTECMKQLISLEVDGIITNYPNRLKKLLEE